MLQQKQLEDGLEKGSTQLSLPMVVTSALITPQKSKQSCTPEFPVRNKCLQSKPRKSYSLQNTRTQNSDLMLPLDSILKDENLSKYWNPACETIQSKLWLPHQTVCREVGLRSSVKSLNFTEEKLSSWKTVLQPKVLTQQHLLLFSLPTATPKVEKEVVVATRKIRLYPNDGIAFDLLSLHRRAYNLAIEHFKNTPYKEQKNVTELRREIKKKVKSEWEDRKYEAEVAGEAVRTAYKTRASVIKKRKQGLVCDYSYKSIKETSQFFIKQRLTKSITKMFKVTEVIAKESYGRTTIISFKNNRWFLNSLISIEALAGVENQELRVTSIDPGVRTFATTYSTNSVVKYGDKFHQEKVFPLLLQLDKWLGKLAIFKNGYKVKAKLQSYFDTTKFYQKKVWKLRNRIDDLMSDLHRRVAFDIVSTSDVILLPTFETQEMSKKIKRKLHTKTVRSMLGLRHYQFKLYIKWLAKKYGKLVIDVNEAYTSKTKSWSGAINSTLGGSKVIKSSTIVVDRDVNGARGILLRALTR